MRYAVGVLCLLGSLALLYAGLRPPPKPVVPPVPDFTIDTPVKDFGEVDQFSELRHTFTLTNTHPEPVEVLDVVKSCACSVTEVTPKVIPPGGTATLEVLWKVGKSKDKVGTGMGIVYAVAGRQQKPILIQMTTQVVPILKLNPQVVLFETDRPQTKYISLETRPGYDISIFGTTVNSRMLSVSILPDRKSIICSYSGLEDGAKNVEDAATIAVKTDHPILHDLDVPIRFRTPLQHTVENTR